MQVFDDHEYSEPQTIAGGSLSTVLYSPWRTPCEVGILALSADSAGGVTVMPDTETPPAPGATNSNTPIKAFMLHIPAGAILGPSHGYFKCSTGKVGVTIVQASGILCLVVVFRRSQRDLAHLPPLLHTADPEAEGAVMQAHSANLAKATQADKPGPRGR